MSDKFLAEIDQEVITAAREMGSNRVASLARVMSILFLYYGSEKIFASEAEPIVECRDMLRRLISFFQYTSDCGFPPPHLSSLAVEAAAATSVESVTGDHYGRLFQTFSQESYWEEPRKLLQARLERNQIDLSSLPNMHVLDAGCGGGRYTLAWRMLNANRATGVDISPVNIATAGKRIEESGIDGVDFEEGNVLALPFPDKQFDIVFSNGVLHHTRDWKTGVAELLRVLKPGGWGWLYLIEEPGGLYWELIEILRAIMQEEDRTFAQQIMRFLEISENHIFYMLDHVMAPINLRLTAQEIKECLTDCGAVEIKRLTRGADFDRIERIYRQEPHAASKFGGGENRFIFQKPLRPVDQY